MTAAGAAQARESLQEPQPSERSIRALDWLNFFKADAQTTVGPYLAIFLLAVRRWDAGKIGVAMSVPGFVAVFAQTPVGALVDWTTHRRDLVIISSLLLGIGCIILVAEDSLVTVSVAQAIVAVATLVIPPAIAAISVGLVGHLQFPTRMGRNEAFSHGGAVAAAIAAGAIAYWFTTASIFYFAALMSVGTALAAYMIREDEIDPVLAREGATEGDTEIAATALSDLMRSPRIVIFIIAVVLFHLANAAMLPLVGEMLSGGNELSAAPYMSACIIVSQAVMLPIALVAGRVADSWGRKPIFLIGFAALPLRALLFALIRNPFLLVTVQILDGIGAGIFGVVSVIMVADLARGTGRFNLLQGAMNTCIAVGSGVSNLIAGFVAARRGFSASFMLLTAFALFAMLFFWMAMPETKNLDLAPSSESLETQTG
jgi:predicted MFS family arabinose efflux permease